VDLDAIEDFDGFQVALDELRARGDWQGVARALREALRILATSSVTHVAGRPRPSVETDLWKELGLVYRDRLGDREGASMVVELLASRGSSLQASPTSNGADTTRAVATGTLSPDAYADRVVFHLQRGELDAAWCAGAAAAYLAQSGAHVDFYEKYAPLEPTPITSGLERPDWFALCHPDEIRAPRSLVRAIEECVKASPPIDDERARSRARVRFEPAALRSPMFRTVYSYAARLLGLPSRCHVSFRVTDEIADAEGLLDGALDAVHDGFTLSELLFIAGKQASYHRDLVLKVLSSYSDARALASAAGVEEAPAARWLRGVELTASRAGLLVSGDLRTAKRVLENEPLLFSEAVSVEEKLCDLLAFATDARYLTLRRKTGLALVSPEKPVRRRPVTPTSAPHEVTIGSRERRARTASEMHFAASMHPCRTCGATPRECDLDLRAHDGQRLLLGQCRFCSNPLRYAFFVEDAAPERFCSRHELGDSCPSQILEPAELIAELGRLVPLVRATPRQLAPSEWTEAMALLSRAITCAVELLKFEEAAIAGRVTRAQLVEVRDRLFAIEADFDSDAPRIWETARGFLSGEGEIRGLLQQARARVPCAEDLRAYFASRRKPITVTSAAEMIAEVGSAAVARARIVGNTHGDTVVELVLTSCTVDELRSATRAYVRTPLSERPLDGTLVLSLMVNGHPVRVRAEHRGGRVGGVVVTFLRPREPKPSRLAEILEALLAEEAPKTVGALARALGVELTADDVPPNSFGGMAVPPEGHSAPTTDVASVSAQYVWDRFHERPVATLVDLLSRPLVEWTVGFAHPLSALEGALASRLGPPRRVGSSRSSHVHGSWIATSTSERSSTLSFHTKLPDWAVAPPDAVLRERALVELAAMLAATDDRAVLDRAATSLPRGCGLSVAPRPAPSSGHVPGLSIQFVPAIFASELARVLGWERPVGLTRTVHRDIWEVWLAKRDAHDVLAIERPGFGPWGVTATLDKPPSGMPLGERGTGPLGDAYDVGPEDVVRWLRIG